VPPGLGEDHTSVENQGIDPLSGAKSNCGAQFWNSPGDFIIFHVLQVPSPFAGCYIPEDLGVFQALELSPYVNGLNSHID